VNRRGWTGQIVDLVDLYVEREDHIVAHRHEARMREAVGDVLFQAPIVVVDAYNLVAIPEQPLAEMRADKARAARHQDCRHGAPPWTAQDEPTFPRSTFR
jgi:hypothetical protein